MLCRAIWQDRFFPHCFNYPQKGVGRDQQVNSREHQCVLQPDGTDLHADRHVWRRLWQPQRQPSVAAAIHQGINGNHRRGRHSALDECRAAVRPHGCA